MFSASFAKRLAKETLTAFVVAGGGALLIASDSIGRDLLLGAAVAGLRAVVGVVVKDFGEFKDTPSV